MPLKTKRGNNKYTHKSTHFPKKFWPQRTLHDSLEPCAVFIRTVGLKKETKHCNIPSNFFGMRIFW